MKRSRLALVACLLLTPFMAAACERAAQEGSPAVARTNSNSAYLVIESQKFG